MSIVDDVLNGYYAGANQSQDAYDAANSITRVNYADPNLALSQRYAQNLDRQPGNFVTNILDVLSRGNYFSATLADGLISGGLNNLPQALSNAASEVIDPQARLSYRDILSRYAPDFTQQHPYVSDLLGLGLDIGLDPTTYIGAGFGGKAKKVGGLALSDAGQTVLKSLIETEGIRLANEIGNNGAQNFIRKSVSTLFRSNQQILASQYGEAILGKMVTDAPYLATTLERLGLKELIGVPLTEKKGLRIFLGAGKYETEIPVYKALDPLFDNLGITAAKNNLTNVVKEASILGYKPGQAIADTYNYTKDTLKGMFVKDYGLSPEIADALRFYENKLGNLSDDVVRDIFSIKDLAQAKEIDLTKISSAYNDINKFKDNITSLKGFLPDDDRALLYQQVFKQAGLNSKEIGVTSSLLQKANDLDFVNYGTSLLTEQVRNYAKGVDSIITNTDDYLRFMQAGLDGNLHNFVATNPNLQSKVFSMDVAKQFFNKQEFLADGKHMVYGSKIQQLTNANLAENLERYSVSKSLTDAISKSTSAITNATGVEGDTVKIFNSLLKDGFKVVGENPNSPITAIVKDENNNILKTFATTTNKSYTGTVIDSAGQPINQLMFKHDDGSIIRVLTEANPSKTGNVDYTIIKSVASPNEGFAKGIIGSDVSALPIGAIKQSAKEINPETILDPFGNTVTSLYDGKAFADTVGYLKNTGVDTDVNALTLYAQRALMTQKQASDLTFKEALKLQTGVETIDELPKAIKSRLKYLGEGLYPSGMNEYQKKALQAYDSALGVFKFAATSARPMFAPRQIPQNSLQMFIAGGKDVFAFLDPRVPLEAAGMLIDNALQGKTKLADFIVNNFYRNPEDRNFFSQALSALYKNDNLDNLATSVIVNPLGQKASLKELFENFRDLGVLKSQFTDNFVKRDLLAEVAAATNNNKGALSFLKSTFNYTTWPEHVENFFRVGYGINAFRQGMDLKDSAKLVDKALFNYQTSLTEFERRFMKRIIPFYTFQSNAIPLIVNSIFERPGVVAASYKGQQTFLDIWNKLNGGQVLTPLERKITPDFIWEQTSKFKGRDEQGNLNFSTFNSYTPYDALNLIKLDKSGDIDAQGTMKQIVLSNISPYIKMTVELGMNRYMFSDRAITESAKVGGIGRYLNMLPEPAKQLLQLETYTDPRTNKATTYINPWLAYGLSNIPVLNEVIRPLDPDKTVAEAVQSLITGVQTYKYNKQELQVADSLNYRRNLQELRTHYELALKQHRPDEAAKRLQELRQFIMIKAKENTYQNPPLPATLNSSLAGN